MESESNNVNAQETPKEEPAKSVKNTNDDEKNAKESEQRPNTNGVEVAEEVMENGYKNEVAAKEDISGVKDGQVEDDKVAINEEVLAETPTKTQIEIPEESPAKTSTEIPAPETSVEAKSETPAEATSDVQPVAAVESKEAVEGKLIEIDDEKEVKSLATEATTEEIAVEVDESSNEAVSNTIVEVEVPIEQVQEEIQKELEETLLKIEDEIKPTSIDQNQLDPDILKRIENHLESIGFSNYTLKVEPHTEIRSNLSTKTFRIEISNATTNLNWMVRATPQAESVGHMVEIGRLYQNEELTYQKLFPAYQKLEDDRLLINPFDSYSKYHLSSTDFLKEFVVISDIAQEYFEPQRAVGLRWPSVNLAMKAYGKLHALSYALKIKEPSLFSKLGEIFRSNFAVVNEIKEDRKAIFENHVLTTLDPSQEAYKKLSKLIQNLPRVFSEISVNEYSVIGYCCNKLAFSFMPHSPRNSICFLDFQNAKYASPACDLSHFLYCYTDKHFRESHYNSAIKLYYYTLCGHLNELGFDPEKILPYEALEIELKRSAVVGLCTAILELAATFKDDLTEPIFTSRVRDSIVDFNASGYFPTHF